MKLRLGIKIQPLTSWLILLRIARPALNSKNNLRAGSGFSQLCPLNERAQAQAQALSEAP